ncbi:MAG: putative rane protein, partial [Pseudomonadota bacterium]
TEGVVRASTETGIGMALALIEVTLSVLLFAACSWHVRARFKNRAALAAG